MPTFVHRNPLRAAVVGGLLLLAAFALAAFAFVSAHNSACAARDANADLLHDVIVVALTPPKGSPPPSLAQQKAAKAFLRRIDARIDLSRC